MVKNRDFKKYLAGAAILLLSFFQAFQVYSQNTLIESSQKDQLYFEAMELLNREKFSAARKTFEDFLEVEKMAGTSKTIRVAEANYYIAFCALNLFNPDAERLFVNFIEEFPWHTKADLAYFELGSFFYNEKKYDKVIEYLEKADQEKLSEGQKMELQFKLGYAYFSQKQFEKASEYFDRIKNKDHAYTYAASYYAGYLELKEGKYDEALNDLKSAEKNEAYASVVPYLIANVYYQQGENDKLISYAEQLVERKDIKEKAELYLLVAEAQFMKGNYEKASVFFENYASASRGKLSEPLQYRLAFSQYQTGKYKEAAQNFKPIASSDDALGQVSSYYLGLSYLRTGDKQYALLPLRQASKVDFSKQIQEEALFNYAKVNAELNNYNEAIATLKTFNRRYPKSDHVSEADELLGESFLKTSNYTEAINYIESLRNRSLRLNTAYQRVTFYKGVEEFNNKRFDKAIEMFNKSAQFPIDKDIFLATNYWRGEAYSIQKDFEKAINSYSKVFQNTNFQNEYHIKSRYGIAYAYYNLGQYDKALGHFKAYTETLENQTKKLYYDDAILRLADIYAYDKDYEKAISNYDKAIKSRNPNLDYAYYKKGVVLPFQNKNEEALQSFEKVISSFPNSLYVDDALYGKAEIIFTRGEFTEAIPVFSTVIEKYPNSPYIPYSLNSRAISYNNLGRYDSTIEDFRKIIYEYPNHPLSEEALAGIQDALSKADRSEEFEYFREEFVKNNPTSNSLVNIDYQAARSLFNNQKYERAIEALKGYIEKYPESPHNPDAEFFLAESYLKSGRSDVAAEQFKLVISKKKSDYYTRAILRLADIYFKNKEYDKAKDTYNELLSNSNNSKERSIAWASLMETYFALKEFDSVKVFANLIVNQSKYSLDVNKAYLYQGKVAYVQGDFDAAIDYFITTINLAKDVNAAEAKYMIAKILYDQKKYKQSLEMLYELNNSFYNYEDWLAKSFLLIADNFIATDELFQAKATLQSIIEKSSHEPSVQKAKVKLDELQKIEMEGEGSNE